MIQNRDDDRPNVLQEVAWNWCELSPITRVLAPLWLALLLAGCVLWMLRLLSLAQMGAWALMLLALVGLNALLVRRADARAAEAAASGREEHLR